MRATTVRGMAAGAVGTWAMDVLTWAMYRREDPAALAREQRARVHGLDTAHAAAARVRRALGGRDDHPEPNAGGIAVHYLLGMVPGALYARARRRSRWVTAGRGALWGFGLFVVNDEIMARSLGIAGPARAYPWQAHLRGVVGHVLLGVVTHVVLDAMDDDPDGPGPASR
jgi:hypothetical protein